jgi:hypothetical protein
MNNVVWGGTNRGALTIAQELRPETLNLYAPTLLLADPKEPRAAKFGEVLRNQFATLDPRPLTMRVQDALALSHADDAVVLTVDTIADTSAALAARLPSQRVTWQIAGKGPGGVGATHIALQGTLCPGDKQSERSVSLLLPTLEGMSRAASSRELTRPDPVTAAVLTPLRMATSRLTSNHLSQKGREPWDLSGGPLSVFFGVRPCPLIAVQGSGQDKYSQQIALALDTAGQLPVKTVITRGQSSCMVVVAVVIPQAQTVHFIRVALKSTGKRSIAGLTTFAPQRASSTESAVFTD